MGQNVGTLLNGISRERQHGLLFDGAVFMSAMVGAEVTARTGGAWSERFVGLLLLLALVTQVGGALLKRQSLSKRLAERVEQRQPDFLDRFMDVLLFLHFILFTVVTIMGLSLAGIAPAKMGDAWVAGALATAAVATYLVRRAAKPGAKSMAATAVARSEYLADGLLWISASIITNTFWVMLVGDVGAAAGIGLNLRAVVLLLALSLLFVVFYLPVRYLFLVEDYRSPRTWLQMWLAMVPVARSILLV